MASLPVRALPDSSLQPIAPLPRIAATRPIEVAVEVVDTTDVRVPELGQHRGGLYREWLDHWKALSPSERDPLTHPAWLASWFAHRAAGLAGEHRLLIARDECGALLNVLPARVDPCRRGCKLVIDTGLESGALAVADEHRSAVLESVFQQSIPGFGRPRSLLLARVDGTNVLLRDRKRQLAEPLAARSLIDVTAGHDALMRRWSGNFRSSLRRAHKKLAKLGDVRLQNLTHPEDMEEGLARFAHIDARSWKRESGETVIEDLSLRRMLAACLPAMAAEGTASVQVLSVEGEDIAGQVSVLVDDVLHVMKMSFDSRHRESAPGNVLFDETLHRIAPRLGASWVSLVAALDWHGRWRPWPLPTSRVWYFAPGMRGLAGRLFDVPSRTTARCALQALGIEPPKVKAWIPAWQRSETA